MMCWVSLCCHIRRHQSYLVKFCEFLTLIYSGTYICQTNLTRYVSCHPPPPDCQCWSSRSVTIEDSVVRWNGDEYEGSSH